jgi:hypothetical protein
MVTPEGLARWWTKASDGTPQIGAEYRLFYIVPYENRLDV